MVTRALENMFMFWIGGLNKRLMDHIALLKSIPNNKQSQESDIFVSFLVNKKFKSNHKTDVFIIALPRKNGPFL